MKLFVTLIVFAFSNFANAQNAKEFMIGTFEYCEDDTHSVVVMGKKKVVETRPDQGGEVVITSKIEWLADNKYQLTITKVKGNAGVKKGYGVIVFVKEIKDGKAELSFTFKDGQKSANCFKKMN